MDPEGPAESFPSLQGLGEAPALVQQQDAESFSNQGGAPALHRMYSESSASNSAFSSEKPMSSRHKLSEVLTKLSIMATCLQECISTMVELQSDSFNQQDAHLGTRESSFSSLTSFRNIGSNNNNEQEEERSSLGELTPRTCRSKSEEGAHPEELEQAKLKQEEAKQQEEQEQAVAQQLTAQQKGPATTTTTTTTKASDKEAETASKTQKMVQHMLEERTYHRSLLVQRPAAQPAAPTSLDHTKPNAATDCSSFSDGH